MDTNQEQLKCSSSGRSTAQMRFALTVYDVPVMDLSVVRVRISDTTVELLHGAMERRQEAIGQALSGEWTMSLQKSREMGIDWAWKVFAQERDAILQADPWYAGRVR